MRILPSGLVIALAFDAGQLSFDVEVADLPEVEEPPVEPGPDVHAAAMDIVCQVVDDRETHTRGVRIDAGQRHEIDVVDCAARAIAVDEVDQAAANPLDRRDVELHRPDAAEHRLGAQFDRPLISHRGILHPERDCTDARAVQPRKALRKAFRFGIDDEIDVALAVERHPL